MMHLEGLTLKIESRLDKFFCLYRTLIRLGDAFCFFKWKKKKKKVDQKEKGKVVMDFITVILVPSLLLLGLPWWLRG